MKTKNTGEAGFSMIEAMVAILITLVGLLAVELLITHAIRVQVFSRDTAMATSLARAQVERLRALPRTNAQRANGGSLTSNQTDYHDATNSRFTTRWTVADGPAESQDVTVAVLSAQGSLMPTVQIRVLLP